MLIRYCIERVFRPRKLDRAHPKELLECVFDIVVPLTSSLLPDAETIYAISEVIQEFSALQVHKAIYTVCSEWSWFNTCENSTEGIVDGFPVNRSGLYHNMIQAWCNLEMYVRKYGMTEFLKNPNQLQNFNPYWDF